MGRAEPSDIGTNRGRASRLLWAKPVDRKDLQDCRHCRRSSLASSFEVVVVLWSSCPHSSSSSLASSLVDALEGWVEDVVRRCRDGSKSGERVVVSESHLQQAKNSRVVAQLVLVFAGKQLAVTSARCPARARLHRDVDLVLIVGRPRRQAAWAASIVVVVGVGIRKW